LQNFPTIEIRPTAPMAQDTHCNRLEVYQTHKGY
jgi:hypothetical protein